MKRILLLTVVVGLFAGQAFADMYTFDVPTAANLRSVSWSDPLPNNSMTYIGYNPGTAADLIAGSSTFGVFNPPLTPYMTYAVGFRGNLSDNDSPADGFASVKIGVAGNTGGVLTAIQALPGTFDGFYLPIANDNNQKWEYAVYVDPAGAAYYESGFTALNSLTQTTVTLGSFGSVAFSSLDDIGFIIRVNTSLIGGNTSDDFHTSIVPVPAALLLGLLGMGAAGLKLRRFA